MLLKENLRLKAFGVLNAPIIGFVAPKIEKLTLEETVIRVPLNWKTKRRDLSSMYLGALVVGAEIAGAIMAYHKELETDQKYSIIFKSINSDFIKRPESDVLFRCADGIKVSQMLVEARDTGQRMTGEVDVIATCPKQSETEVVARFKLLLTVKLKKARAAA